MDGTDRRGTLESERPGQARHRRVAAATLIVLLGFAAAACSSDASDGGSPPSDAAATTDSDAAEGADDGGPGADDGAALTAEDICAMLPAGAVTEAIGREITAATPSTGSTPQCAYSYASESGPDSNLTVAASRYTSSDAQTIEQAYDAAVQINLSTAGGTDVDQREVAAGDEAVVLSGEALDLGVLRVGNVLGSLIVPPDVLDPAQIEALMVAIGDSLS